MQNSDNSSDSIEDDLQSDADKIINKAGPELSTESRELIELLSDRFLQVSETNHIDLALLYEVTGYQGVAENPNFWDDFDDSHDIHLLPPVQVSIQ